MMKQILLICGLLLCIATIGYSQGQGATTGPPVSRDVLNPTTGCPIGVVKTNSSVVVWSTAVIGKVDVYVKNTVTGATQFQSLQTDGSNKLSIDVSVSQIDNCKVTVKNRFGTMIENF